MDSLKEKEFDKTIHYANLFITTCILVLLVLCEGKKSGYIKLPYFNEKVSNIILKYGLFLEKNFLSSIAFILLIFLAMQTPAKSNLKATRRKGQWYLFLGLTAYLGIIFNNLYNTEFYIFLLILSAIIMVVSMISSGINFNSMVDLPQKDLFNRFNEQFPQNEKLYENGLSVTYYHQYMYRNTWRVGIVPVIAPDRGVLVLGGQGSGKTYTCFNPAIYQSLAKGFSLLVYDYAYPDLSKTVFNGLVNVLQSDKYTFGKHFNGEPIVPEFHMINFEDLRRSSRCNPFIPRYMSTIDECHTLCKNILYNLNKSWTTKEGDFWATSAVNLLTTYVWFLRIIERNNPEHPVLSTVCTLPHAITLLTVDINEVISAISCEPELDAYSNMFVQGLKNQAGNQIAGQIASVQAGLAPLSSPNVAWVMTGDEMELEINHPDNPRIITMGNFTPKATVYGAALSVYTSIIMKRSYMYRDRKFAIIIDELPTLFLLGLDDYIATIRKHLGCVWMGIQDIEQLVKNFGKASADIIVNTCGTIMSGLVNGTSAERMSKLFGKTEQENYSTSIGKDTSVSYSTQSKELLPASKIMSLSQGQFVGKFADRFETPVEQKLFSGYFVVPEIEQKVKELPYRNDITEEEMEKMVNKNIEKIRSDIKAVRDYCISTYA